MHENLFDEIYFMVKEELEIQQFANETFLKNCAVKSSKIFNRRLAEFAEDFIKKQRGSVLQELRNALEGRPFLPSVVGC